MKHFNSNNNKLLRIAATLSTLLMLALIVNRVVFIHTHLLPSGEYITHAHPFSKATDSAPIKQHQHSTYEYFFLHCIGSPVPMLVALTLLAPQTLMQLFPIAYRESIHIVRCVLNPTNKAPPAIFA